MAQENRASTSTTVTSVALQLPPFWPEQPTIWFAQTEAQFAIKINDIGDRKPSALMDHLLGFVGDRSSEFLVREVFLRSLPDKISIVVAASTSGLRDLALEADRHFATFGILIATAQPTINKVQEPTPEVHTSFRPRRAARNRQPAQTGLCYYHVKITNEAYD